MMHSGIWIERPKCIGDVLQATRSVSIVSCQSAYRLFVRPGWESVR